MGERKWRTPRPLTQERKHKGVTSESVVVGVFSIYHRPTTSFLVKVDRTLSILVNLTKNGFGLLTTEK